MEIPDLTQRLVGFRQWHVSEDGVLSPVATKAGGQWFPGAMHAKCMVTHDQMHLPCLPVVNDVCHCGFYALHRLNDAVDYGGIHGRNTVQGIVTGWGRVAVHREGFRAEWIEFMAVIVPPDIKDRSLYKKVAFNYNVPIMDYAQAEAYAAEFGARVPEALMPSPEESVDYFFDEDDEFDSIDFSIETPAILGERRRVAAREARRIKGHNELIPGWLLDVAVELDPECPEAMAGLYDIYVPNVGDLILALNDPPKPTYERFPDEPLYTPEIQVIPDRFGQFICTNGAVAYLPKGT